MKTYTREALREHNKKAGRKELVAFNGYVLDVGTFGPAHPGGEEAIQDGADYEEDATRAMWDIGHSEYAIEKMVNKEIVGRLADEEQVPLLMYDGRPETLQEMSAQQRGSVKQFVWLSGGDGRLPLEAKEMTKLERMEVGGQAVSSPDKIKQALEQMTRPKEEKQATAAEGGGEKCLVQ